MERVSSRAERWWVLAAGVGLLTVAGAVFSWSLYARPLKAFFGWSSFEVALAFSVVVVFIGVGAILGGFLHDRFGPRRIGIAGALLWGIGSILSGLGLAHFGLLWLYVTYGVIGGTGCGMMYVVPGACVTRWFPEERGLANGVTLCGFGLGSLVFNLVAGLIPAFAHAADAATRIITLRDDALAAGRTFVLPPHIENVDIGVVASLFTWSGVAFAVIGCLCAFVLHAPPAGYVVPKAAAMLAKERDFTPREMLRTPAFYLMWLVILVNGTCGLALFSNAVAIYADLTNTKAVIATLAFGWISSANGLGRFLWAWLSDGFGRTRSLFVCFILEGVAMLGLAHAHDTFTVSIAFAIILLCFGGVFGVAPAVMADFYGTRFLGEDYSFIITAASAAGLIGPLLVAFLEDALGSLTSWLTPLAITLLVASILPLLMRQPRGLPEATASH